VSFMGVVEVVTGAIEIKCCNITEVLSDVTRTHQFVLISLLPYSEGIFSPR